MPRSIAVYRELDGEWLSVDALGSEEAIRIWWSEPAHLLGLPMIASIYEHGFYHGIEWAGDELDNALTELSKLKEHWLTAGLPIGVATDLAARAEIFRAAVMLAKKCGGLVSIT